MIPTLYTVTKCDKGWRIVWSDGRTRRRRSIRAAYHVAESHRPAQAVFDYWRDV